MKATKATTILRYFIIISFFAFSPGKFIKVPHDIIPTITPREKIMMPKTTMERSLIPSVNTSTKNNSSFEANP